MYRFLFCLLILSCQQNNCKKRPYPIIKGTIFGFTRDFEHLSSTKEGHYYETSFDESDFSQISSNLKLNEVFSDNEKSIILPQRIFFVGIILIMYLDKNLDSNFRLDPRDIKGYLLYYIRDKKLYTKVITMENNLYKINPEFSLPVQFVGSHDIYTVGANLVSKNTRTAIYLGLKGVNYSMYKNAPIFTNSLRKKFYPGEIDTIEY